MTVANNRSLTVVIPTRERSDTLYYAIQTCVEQGFENMEILVVDNFSNDDTEAVVSSFSDKRIKYINSGRRLSMTANWELALNNIYSDYVMFIGDDDGILPGAVSDLMALAANHENVEAITWPSVDYGWPSCQNQTLRNTIVVGLVDKTEYRLTSDILSDVLKFRRSYSELPFIYKGLVKTEVVKRLRAASGGTVLNSMIPDIYFGIASCAVIEKYLYSYRPYTLNGASSHSNGTSSFASVDGKGAELKFLSEENIPFHSSLVFCPSIPVLVIESLIQAQAKLPVLQKYPVDLDLMVRAATQQLARVDRNVFEAVMKALYTIAESVDLQADTVETIRHATNKPFFQAKRVYGQDVFNRRYLVDCEAFSVDNCFAASVVADCVLKLNRTKQISGTAAAQNSMRLLVREISKRTGWFQ